MAKSNKGTPLSEITFQTFVFALLKVIVPIILLVLGSTLNNVYRLGSINESIKTIAKGVEINTEEIKRLASNNRTDESIFTSPGSIVYEQLKNNPHTGSFTIADSNPNPDTELLTMPPLATECSVSTQQLFDKLDEVLKELQEHQH